MKILSKTETRLVLVEPWPTVGHWGIFMLCLTGPALYLLLTDPRPKVMPAIWLSGFFFAAGLVTAFFLNKRLRHVLDKSANTLTVEYPVYMNARLETEVIPLSDIAGIATVDQPFDFMQGAARHGNYGKSLTGFCYILKSGKKIKSGLYSSDQTEIDRAASAVRAFLGLRAEGPSTAETAD